VTFEAVVLAAGRSSRAGGFKPALDCGGVPLVVRAVRAFAVVCARVWLVTGYRGDEVAALVAGEPGVTAVANPDWERGMFSSVRAGAARVTADRFFVTPGDLPLLNPGVVAALARVPGSVVAPVFEGQGGHPVLLDHSWVARILVAGLESNLRDLLAGTGRTEVAMADDGVLRDIDTCEDYEDYLRRTSWALN
jgi:molybdenum cofactor cytidylyltransferase